MKLEVCKALLSLLCLCVQDYPAAAKSAGEAAAAVEGVFEVLSGGEQLEREEQEGEEAEDEEGEEEDEEEEEQGQQQQQQQQHSAKGEPDQAPAKPQMGQGGMSCLTFNHSALHFPS